MGMFDDLIPSAAMAGNLYRRKPSLLSDVDVGLTPPILNDASFRAQ
jgi:hypothetical protein